MLHATESDVRSAVAAAAAVERVRDALRQPADDPPSIALLDGTHVRAQVARHGELTAVLADGSSRGADGSLLTVFGAAGTAVAVIEADWLTRLGGSGCGGDRRRPPGAARRAAGRHRRHRAARRRRRGVPARDARGGGDTRRADLPDAQSAIRDATVIVTATRSRDPVLRDDWMGPASASWPWARRVPTSASSTTGRSCARRWSSPTRRVEAHLRAADLAETVATGHLDWLEVHALDELERGELQPLRRPEDVTIYKGVGTARLALAVALPLLG